jgi:hypothetical protein
MEKRHILLDLIISPNTEYLNIFLTEDEFLELVDFVKKNCFVLKEQKEEDKWEYKYHLYFLYRSIPLLLRDWKSYSSQEENFILSREVRGYL